MKFTKRFMIFLIAILITSVFSSQVLATNFVRPTRVLSRVEDEGELLSSLEEVKLRKKLDEISEKHNVDVVVVTNYSLGGKTPMEYADDYFDYNGYGLGPNYDGVLLLLSMEERDWWISTHAFGITAFTDKGIEYIGEKILGNLSDGNYYDAFDQFADLSDEFITQAKEGEPFDVNNMPKNKRTPLVLAAISGLGLAVGGGAGGGFVAMQAATHKTKKKKTTAMGYQLGVANFVNSHDRFVNRNVTRSAIPKNTSSGGGGGSSTHTSSSGSSHGGGGGKF